MGVAYQYAPQDFDAAHQTCWIHQQSTCCVSSVVTPARQVSGRLGKALIEWAVWICFETAIVETVG